MATVMAKKHQDKLREMHAEATEAGLLVRFWAEGVLVVCSPEHGDGQEERNLEIPLEEGAARKVPSPKRPESGNSGN